jgi:hypothetical protein
MTTSPAINLADLLKIAEAYRTLDQLVKESRLTNEQHGRYCDTIIGKVVLDRVLQKLDVIIEVKA